MTVREPAVFWLDGHYSGEGTASGEKETPLALELTALAAHPVKDHIVLMDDARMLGMGDYPDREAICSALHRMAPRHLVGVADDIVFSLSERTVVDSAFLEGRFRAAFKFSD